jgi:polysaccharide export outer membrane protein
MRHWIHYAALLLLPAMTLPAAAQQDTKKKDDTKVARATNIDPKPRPATEDPNYIIGAEDVLDINVWKEPDLTRVVPVRPDGKISLPLLNDVQAAGLTPLQLGLLITENLRKFLTEPQVTIIVTQINSRRIYLLGEVAKPGAYSLLPNMTVLQALSSGGGFSNFAKQRKIYVLRTENGKSVKYPFDYKEVLAGRRPEENIVLQPGDTIVVP